MTAAVTKTWDICRNITQIPILREVMKTAESDILRFVGSFNDIAQAYADGLMAYGMFTAVKERPL